MDASPSAPSATTPSVIFTGICEQVHAVGEILGYDDGLVVGPGMSRELGLNLVICSEKYLSMNGRVVRSDCAVWRSTVSWTW
jgi:hypothetical protein